MHAALLCHYWICRTLCVNPWGGGSHRSTRWDSQTHAVVSPAAAQLIQTLTTIGSPPTPLPRLLPFPGGSHSVTGHSHPLLWVRGPAAGAEAWGTREGQREKSKRGRGKKGGCEEARERGKGGGEVGGGHLSHSLSYTKVPSVPVILAAES